MALLRPPPFEAPSRGFDLLVPSATPLLGAACGFAAGCGKNSNDKRR